MTLEQAKKEFSDFLNSYNPDASLIEIHNAFVMERMRMDKFFSDFLVEHEKDMSVCDEYNNESWQTYKEKLKQYTDVERYITHSKYYLNKHV